MMANKWKVTLGLAALLAVFLLGFIPQFLKARRLSTGLDEARNELAALHTRDQISHLRDLAASMYVEVNRKNFGVAGERATEFFDQAGNMAGTTGDPELQQKLRAILALRDPVTRGLASADAAVLSNLQEVFLQTQSLRSTT